MEKVSFYSAGAKLTGFLRIPKVGNSKLPGIVGCHGFSGNLELYMQDIAERLSQAGYATLIFYHRGFGESQGPKGRLIPLEQAEDTRNAITYLQSRTEVDPSRIGLYGTSFGGANVVYAAALDSRAKCVVSTGGIGDGERWLKSQRRRWEWVEFLKKVEEDRARRVLTGSSQHVPPEEILPPTPDRLDGIEKRKKSQQEWDMKGYPLETAEAILEYKPELVADRISPRPVLFIHTGNDLTVDMEESWNMYQRAKEPKRIVIIDGLSHMDVYKNYNPAGFDKTMSAAIDWFRKYLSLEEPEH